jgi:hypothetical protein
MVVIGLSRFHSPFEVSELWPTGRGVGPLRRIPAIKFDVSTPR